MECTESGRKYQYNYNSRGQLTGYTELTASGNAYTDLAQSFFWYDDLNRLEYTQTSFRYAVGNTNYLSDADYYDAVGYWYTYDNSASGNSAAGDAGTGVDTLTELEVSGGGLNTGATISYGYDSLYRLATRTTTANGSAGFSQTVSYGYRQVSAGRTSGQVSSYQSTIGDTTTRYTYTYDSSGNITRITDQSGNVTRYTYDKLGQLTREDNPYLGKTYVYAYDKAGNRTSKTTYDYTTGTLGTDYTQVNYSYDDGAWGDQLTGTTYDEIGNPDTYNGYSLTWNGRQLMKMSMNNGQFEYRFTYNDEGIRTSKTYGSTTHYYTLNGSQIVTETWVTKSSDGTETPNHFLVYLYDESGAPIGLQYRNKTYEKYDFDTYYFEKNLQGDIIAIYTESGTKIGSYTYDAWGNCTYSYATGATPTQKKIVQMFNPFRYRGYYYDYDTGLYYLQSRYYVPQWGRFLNADGYVSTGTGLLGYNMYAYCNNNPVMYVDPTGDFPWLIIVLLIGGVTLGLSSCSNSKDNLEASTTGDNKTLSSDEIKEWADNDPILSKGRYSTFDDALMAGLDYANNTSKTCGTEVGGYVFERYGGYYYKVGAIKGRSDSGKCAVTVNLESTDTLLAVFHTHPIHKEDTVFSLPDYKHSKRYGVDAYIIDNIGHIYKLPFDAKTQLDYIQIR